MSGAPHLDVGNRNSHPRTPIRPQTVGEDAMNDMTTRFEPNIARYEAMMDVVRNRLTTRQFKPDIAVPREHIEMVLEAARHGPSGANAQPWHYIVVTDPAVKKNDRRLFRGRAAQARQAEDEVPDARIIAGWRPRRASSWWPPISASCGHFRCCSTAPTWTSNTRPMPSASCCRALPPRPCRRISPPPRSAIRSGG